MKLGARTDDNSYGRERHTHASTQARTVWGPQTVHLVRPFSVAAPDVKPTEQGRQRIWPSTSW